MVSALCVLALLALLARRGAGSAVLVVFPVPSRSHTLLGDHLVSTLLHAGHNVTNAPIFTSYSTLVSVHVGESAV